VWVLFRSGGGIGWIRVSIVDFVCYGFIFVFSAVSESVFVYSWCWCLV
jgi:hypothetical protein